jgi:hypothetical protein
VAPARDERSRRDQIARNEAIFRSVNERSRGPAPHVTGPLPYFCECGHVDCIDQLRLHDAEYEGVRQRSNHFFVIPGHEIPDVERVVETHDHYVVIEKHADTIPIVEGTDPRRAV